jgi:hypothetical protein
LGSTSFDFAKRAVRLFLRDESILAQPQQALCLTLRQLALGTGGLRPRRGGASLAPGERHLRLQIFVPQRNEQLAGFHLIALVHGQYGDLPSHGGRQFCPPASVHRPGACIDHRALDRAALNLRHQHCDRLRTRGIPDDA